MKILEGEYTLYINNKIRTLGNIVKVTNNGDKINLVSNNITYNYKQETKTYVSNNSEFKIIKFNNERNYYDILDSNSNKIRIIKNNTLKKKQWNLRKIHFYNYIQNVKNRNWLFNKLNKSEIKIAIVDEGIQQLNKENNNKRKIKDFNKLDLVNCKSFKDDKLLNNWWPSEYNLDHGTMCASLAVSSGVKLYGTAPGISFCSLKIDFMKNSIKDALSYNINKIDVYSCSFGDPLSIVRGYNLETESIQKGTYLGRKGKGCIYVFACGNDSDYSDLASYDIYLNIPETLVIGSTNKNNKKSFYSETGACLLCVAPGGETGENPKNGIMVFDNKYKIKYNQGTSFSAPQIAGICGVILSIRPNLSWVDVKDIISRSCLKNDPQAGKSNAVDDTVWFKNKAGRNYNLQYGFGLINYKKVISKTSIPF